MNPIWDGRKVTVTGGAGFLGSFLVEALQKECADVFVPRSSSYDLRTVEGAHQMYLDSEPDVLFHLAATVGGIGANRSNPGLFFYENMAMGMNVIEQARNYKNLSRLVLVGTTCSYPHITPVPFQESELWNGYPEPTNAPYGVAKRALMTMASAYHDQYGLDTISVLPANLYGPRDNFDLETSHVIPALVRKFIESKQAKSSTVSLWGTGSASREFLYVEDAATALKLAGGSPPVDEPVNLGTNQEISIRELANLIKEATGFSGTIEWDSSQPDGQPRRRLDITKAKDLFGFSAKTHLENGIESTVKWFLQHRSEL